MSRRVELQGDRSEEPEITIKTLFGNVATPEEARVVGFAETDYLDPVVKRAIDAGIERIATPEALLLIAGISRGEQPDGRDQTYKPQISVAVHAEGWEDPLLYQRAIAASEKFDQVGRELSEMRARPTTKMEVYDQTRSYQNAKQELDREVIFERNDVLTDVIGEEVRLDRKLLFVVGKGNLRDPEFANRLERKLPPDTPYIVVEAEYNGAFKKSVGEAERKGSKNVTQGAKVVILKRRSSK